MATAAVIDEAEYLLTCSVCFNSFDNDDHKPKYLSCHHTLCLACLKVNLLSHNDSLIFVLQLLFYFIGQSISTGTSSSCPLCRKVTHYTAGNEAGLANNPYVFHMLAASSCQPQG